MAEKYKYRNYVIQLAKHTKSHFAQTPEEEAKMQEEMNTFIKSWSPKIEQVMGLHCFGIGGEWDWIGVFGMDDFAHWVGFRETLARRFPDHVEKFVSIPGVSHDAFVDGTELSEHYQALRALGSLPGLAEKDFVPGARS